MFFGLFTLLCTFIALVCIYYGSRLIGRFGWFIGWLRGTIGIALFVLCAFLIFVTLDMYSYKHLVSDKPIITISFTKLDEQKYQADLVYILDGLEESYEISGDQWQIDARVIRWYGLFRALGTKPGYRLDRISGRYYSLQDERSKPRSVHELDRSKYGFDIWSWLQTNGRFMPWIEAVYGSATYLPMDDGAIYQVALSNAGLVSTPLNDRAEKAVNRWR